jgi:hypothetical protein
MTARLAVVASLDRQRAAGPVHRAIIAVDLEGSTQRTDLVKGELRRAMYDLVTRSLDASGITGNRLEPLIDRGDGILVLIRPYDDVPKTVLLGLLIPRLGALLSEYNARAVQPALRIRLRVVVHAGEVREDDQGFYGEAIDVAIRLLDSPVVKRALKQTSGPLVLVVSHDIYSAIVRHDYLPGDPYFPLRVKVGNGRQRGWMHIPGPYSPAVVVPSQRASARSARPAHPGFRASAVAPKRAARSGHR